MGAPVAVGIAAAKSRTGRRIATILLATILVLLVGVTTPLMAVTITVAQASTTTGQPESGPRVVGEWGYPLAPGYHRGRGFGYFPVAGCAYCPAQHYGFDMSSTCGADVFAAGPGRVILARYYGQFGNAVIIDHGAGVHTLYGHLATGSLAVTPGEEVTASTRIGAEGATGVSYGCHLHFEVRINNVRSDPAPFMAGLDLPL